MRPLESLPRQFQIGLTTGLLLAATMATLDGEIRLRLPFDIFPGAAYLALLSLPAFAERSDRADGETDAQLGAYLGPGYTSESDLNLAQPGGTDMTFRDIAWGESPSVGRRITATGRSIGRAVAMGSCSTSPISRRSQSRTGRYSNQASRMAITCRRKRRSRPRSSGLSSPTATIFSRSTRSAEAHRAGPT